MANKLDASIKSYLYKLCRDRDLTTLRKTLKEFDVDSSFEGNGLLRIACTFESMEIVQFLLNEKPEVDPFNSFRDILYHWWKEDGDNMKLCNLIPIIIADPTGVKYYEGRSKDEEEHVDTNDCEESIIYGIVPLDCDGDHYIGGRYFAEYGLEGIPRGFSNGCQEVNRRESPFRCKWDL